MACLLCGPCSQDSSVSDLTKQLIQLKADIALAKRHGREMNSAFSIWGAVTSPIRRAADTVARWSEWIHEETGLTPRAQAAYLLGLYLLLVYREWQHLRDALSMPHFHKAGRWNWFVLLTGLHVASPLDFDRSRASTVAQAAQAGVSRSVSGPDCMPAFAVALSLAWPVSCLWHRVWDLYNLLRISSAIVAGFVKFARASRKRAPGLIQAGELTRVR